MFFCLLAFLSQRHLFNYLKMRLNDVQLSSVLNNIVRTRSRVKAGPLEAILVIFGRRAITFLFEALGKMKMTLLLCACAVVITLETQKC